MAKEGGIGESIDADLKYGQGDFRTPEQLAMADHLLGGEELSLVEEGRESEPFTPPTPVELSPAEQAASSRAEKNAKMMAELIKQKLSAMLDGDKAEETRIAGMISLLEERMK